MSMKEIRELSWRREEKTHYKDYLKELRGSNKQSNRGSRNEDFNTYKSISGIQ
jgi:hypothetical protein